MIGIFLFATQAEAKKLKATASNAKILLPMTNGSNVANGNSSAELPMANTKPLKEFDVEI